MKYRIEFNEEKQHFHLERMTSNREENTNGYFTIASDVTDEDWKIFKIFIDSYAIRNLKKIWLWQKWDEIQNFKNELQVWNREIFKKKS